MTTQEWNMLTDKENVMFKTTKKENCNKKGLQKFKIIFVEYLMWDVWYNFGEILGIKETWDMQVMERFTKSYC